MFKGLGVQGFGVLVSRVLEFRIVVGFRVLRVTGFRL